MNDCVTGDDVPRETSPWKDLMNKQPHPDSFKLIAALKAYDEAQGAHPDAQGRVAGVDSSALLGAAGYRAKLMYESFGPLRKTLTPEQAAEVVQLMSAMWRDGFTARVTYERMFHVEQGDHCA